MKGRVPEYLSTNSGLADQMEKGSGFGLATLWVGIPTSGSVPAETDIQVQMHHTIRQRYQTFLWSPVRSLKAHQHDDWVGVWGTLSLPRVINIFVLM